MTADGRGVVSALETRRQQRSDARVNQERVLDAAIRAVLRDGIRVPLANIAADAGVGIGTLYRHYPTRERLFDAISRRSFDQVLDNALAAESSGTSGIDCVNRFFDATISKHGQLALPLHGGPAIATAETFAVRDRVHETLGRILARGHSDGTIRRDTTTVDIIMFGAMLAQPLGSGGDWVGTADRVKSIYLDGLVPAGPADDHTDAGKSSDMSTSRPGRTATDAGRPARR